MLNAKSYSEVDLILVDFIVTMMQFEYYYSVELSFVDIPYSISFTEKVVALLVNYLTRQMYLVNVMLFEITVDFTHSYNLCLVRWNKEHLDDGVIQFKI